MKSTTPAKEPTTDPDVLWQKESYCWQIGNQFVFVFPLCAKYTIAADADAPAVNNASIAFIHFNQVN
ncbi:hypothetical protein FXO38_17904 [Capsicum annuum]|nr:hypothetical protein FXO37_24214 [Capsicum annuum]KAF3648953.1 hypothetical protein FXO38_17904 [Capsicum annuum]